MSIRRRKIAARSEWLNWRHLNVNASETAAMFGEHDYMTALDLHLIKRGPMTESADSPVLRRGRILEDAVVAAVREERPDLDDVESGYYYDDPEYRLGATPDRIMMKSTSKIVLQCKTVDPIKWDSWEGEPPLGYVLQTLQEIHMAGAESGILACLVLNRAYDLVMFEIPRNDRAWERIKSAARTFWDRMITGQAPTAEYGHDRDALLKLYNRDEGSEIDMAHHNRIMSLVETYDVLRRRRGLCEKGMEAIGDEVIDILGEHTIGLLPNGKKITHKLQSRKESIVPASEFRVLRIPKFKEEKDEPLS